MGIWALENTNEGEGKGGGDYSLIVALMAIRLLNANWLNFPLPLNVPSKVAFGIYVVMSTFNFSWVMFVLTKQRQN